MLQKGASEPWQDILQAFNGQRAMDATAIIDYFQPLTQWLAEQNADRSVGWTDQCPLGTTEKVRLNASVDLHFGGYSERAVKSYSLSFRIIELRNCVKVEVDVLGSRP